MSSPSDVTRAEALEALLRTRDTGMTDQAAAEAVPVKPTGETVDAGGDVERLLVKPAHLGYRTKDGSYQMVDAKVGDRVRLNPANAKRLDALGATVDPDTDLEELAEQDVTDEQLAAMNAPELVAYVVQHPDERPRVRTLEEARDKPRKTVLDATEETPEADDEAQRQAQGNQ